MSTSSIHKPVSASSKRASSKDQPDSPWAFYFLMGTLVLGFLMMVFWLLTTF